MGGGGKLPGKYMGEWGTLGSPPQKGVTTYALSSNRQNPMAKTLHNAIFNTFRRTRGQIFYWAPPMLLGYFTMQYAIEWNEYFNSKAGRAKYGQEEH